MQIIFDVDDAIFARELLRSVYDLMFHKIFVETCTFSPFLYVLHLCTVICSVVSNFD